MEEKNYRFCRKCLTRDLIGKDDYFKSLHELIEGLPDDIKTDAPRYEERLLICKDCDRLIDGMCSACGCYVELRAAKDKEHCPYEKW